MRQTCSCLTALGSGKDYICGQTKIRRHGRGSGCRVFARNVEWRRQDWETRRRWRSARSRSPARLSRNGWLPNNEHFPVLLYRRLQVRLGADPATRFEELFTRNGWPPQWRDGVYDFHHYHSTAHEVLRFAGASARLMLGGENGREVVCEPAICGVAYGHASLPAGGEAGFPRRRRVPAGGVGYLQAGAGSRGGGKDGRVAVPTKRSGMG